MCPSRKSDRACVEAVQGYAANGGGVFLACRLICIRLKGTPPLRKLKGNISHYIVLVMSCKKMCLNVCGGCGKTRGAHTATDVKSCRFYIISNLIACSFSKYMARKPFGSCTIFRGNIEHF